jgi:hypothetical protein
MHTIKIDPELKLVNAKPPPVWDGQGLLRVDGSRPGIPGCRAKDPRNNQIVAIWFPQDDPISNWAVVLSCIKGFSMRQHGERGSVGDAELAINMVQMDLHGSLGHP